MLLRMEDTESLCPACGFDLGDPPWVDGCLSDEICPSCGLQFGYQDSKAKGGRDDAFYHGWRSCWLTHGRRGPVARRNRRSAGPARNR